MRFETRLRISATKLLFSRSLNAILSVILPLAALSALVALSPRLKILRQAALKIPRLSRMRPTARICRKTLRKIYPLSVNIWHAGGFCAQHRTFCFKFSAAGFKILNLPPLRSVYPQELSRQLKFICGANLGAKIKFYLARKMRSA